MNTKRFDKEFGPIADTISRLDVDQTVREQIASALTETLRGRRDFHPNLFRLIASDPLVPCEGPGDDEPCPYRREIRIGMHNSKAADGRSAAWTTHPKVWCVDCGLAVQMAKAQEGHHDHDLRH